MEITGILVAMTPMKVREYTDRQGEKKNFKEAQVLIETGHDTYLVEMTSEFAEKLDAGNYEIGGRYALKIDGRVAQGKDQSGETRYFPHMECKKIFKLS